MEPVILNHSKQFWLEDHILQVSEKRIGGEPENPKLRDLFKKFVEYAYDQQIATEKCSLEYGESARVFRMQIGIRDEMLDLSPGNLEELVIQLRDELQTLETDASDDESETQGVEHQAKIEKLQEKLKVAEVYQRMIEPLLKELADAKTATMENLEEVGPTRDQLQGEVRTLELKIRGLENDGIPAHTNKIHELTEALEEKTEELAQLDLTYKALVVSEKKGKQEFDQQVLLLEGQFEEARNTQTIAERALKEQQEENDRLKNEHKEVLQRVKTTTALKQQELERELEDLRNDKVELLNRVGLLEKEPDGEAQRKVEILDKVATAILGEEDLDLSLLENQVLRLKGEHTDATNKLGELYGLAKLPADSFAALRDVIQALGRIFVAFGYAAEEKYDTLAELHAVNAGEINRKADDYDRVERARADAVQHLGIERAARARTDQALRQHQADSKTFREIFRNGVSWTRDTTTAAYGFVHDATTAAYGFVYNAMRF